MNRPGQDSQDDRVVLPYGYVPSAIDVICGRDIGNQRLRRIIQEKAVVYDAMKSKHDRGQLVVEIVDSIRLHSPIPGGFIRKDYETGHWVEIGKTKAREKVGHALRVEVKKLHQKEPTTRGKLRARSQQKEEVQKLTIPHQRKKPPPEASGSAEQHTSQIDTGQLIGYQHGKNPTLALPVAHITDSGTISAPPYYYSGSFDVDAESSLQAGKPTSENDQGLHLTGPGISGWSTDFSPMRDMQSRPPLSSTRSALELWQPPSGNAAPRMLPENPGTTIVEQPERITRDKTKPLSHETIEKKSS